jgi:hypothetical protein
MRAVIVSERASPTELIEQAEVAEANAREAESERKRWQALAVALRERAEGC